MGIFTTKQNCFKKINVVVFQNRQWTLAVMNKLFLHSVLSKTNQNSQSNHFGEILRLPMLGLPKGLFFPGAAVRRFLTCFDHAT